MAAMEEFAALITSFGESLVMYIGKNRLASLEVSGYEGSETADVWIRLMDNTWDNQLAAIEKIDTVRLMFLGELSFEYRFLDEKEAAAAAARMGAPAYSLAP